MRMTARKPLSGRSTRITVSANSREVHTDEDGAPSPGQLSVHVPVHQGSASFNSMQGDCGGHWLELRTDDLRSSRAPSRRAARLERLFRSLRTLGA